VSFRFEIDANATKIEGPVQQNRKNRISPIVATVELSKEVNEIATEIEGTSAPTSKNP
jgi:hypothetical protein